MGLRIVMSGRTAAGKTTHAQMLAGELDLPYFSAIEELAALMAERAEGEAHRRWSPAVDVVRGKYPSVDDKLDRVLATIFTDASEGVFDASLLPWVAPDVPAVRIWIESDLPSRIRKCIVSHWDENLQDETATERVLAKDAFSAKRLAVAHGARFEPEMPSFNIVICNSSLIPTATPAAAAAGICMFQPVLRDAVLFASGLSSDCPRSEFILRLTQARKP